MKVVGMFDRRFRGRLAMMGLTQQSFCDMIGVSYMGLRNWMKMSALPPAARHAISRGLGVNDSWLDSKTFDDVGEGLDALCNK